MTMCMQIWLEDMEKAQSSGLQSLECVLGTPSSAVHDAGRGPAARIPQALRMTASHPCLMPLPQELCSENANMRLILFAAIVQV